MVISVPAHPSYTGKRNVSLDSQSIRPNTRLHLTGCPLWYLCRPNLLSSISTVLLGAPIFTEQPSKIINMVSVQNMLQSATVGVLRQYSFWIWLAAPQHILSYLISRISWRVRLLCWNHNPCLIDADWLYLTPTTVLWHHQRNPTGRFVSADDVMSRPQVLHCNVLRSRPTSLKPQSPLPGNWIGTSERACSDHRHTTASDVRMKPRNELLSPLAFFVLRNKLRKIRDYFKAPRRRTQVFPLNPWLFRRLQDACCIVGDS